MIQAVTTPAHKQAFATAIQGAPYFRAVMGRDLALWADNPGAPVRLFTLPGAALTLNGSTAQLCGRCSCIVCHLRIVCRWRRNLRAIC